MKSLTINRLCKEAQSFSIAESKHKEKSLYGVTDGKAIGTYLEHKFKKHLQLNYSFEVGSSASGIDFPTLNVDMKVTSIKQPQSSCPYKSAQQKIFGLGYSLIVFVYEKTDNPSTETGTLRITDTIFIDKLSTGDFQTSKGILQILENDGNIDDLVAFMIDRNLPADEIEMLRIAEAIIKNPPHQGYLIISNALQWRLQYSRIIELAGQLPGIKAIYQDR
ncbi:MAG: restriction endonuclease [Candidatus Cloacimonetes bacterium]|nr:restriction endonuclease [Candidatus Cloacimonadota bacterium]